MIEKRIFWIAMVASLAVAFLGISAPYTRMPIDYDAMIRKSIPFAIFWAVILAVCLWRYGKRAWWLLLGAPMALYWPIWLLFNHFPSCYYSHNCV